MAASFKDHFSPHAARYARYRPGYPPALFAYLAALAPGRERAWDCGTGSGQAALGLAPHFARVIATDASAAQVEHAARHERIEYRVEPAEQTSIAPTSVDLVTVAQALHWFDFDGFYTEVRRVLRPGGVLAAWCYSLLQITPALDAVLWRYYDDLVGPCWPPERRHIDAGYQSIPFPFEEIDAPAFQLELDWTLEELLGYLGSWSATQRYIRQHGADPVAQIRPELEATWDPVERRQTRWPLNLRVGRWMPDHGPDAARRCA